jgi:hypothetical protein
MDALFSFPMFMAAISTIFLLLMVQRVMGE